MSLTWTFETGSHYWAFDTITLGSHDYIAKVLPDSFSGMTLRWDISGNGLIAPNEISFDVSDSDYALSSTDFSGDTVMVRIWEDGVESRAWKMTVIQAIPEYGKIRFYCQDFLQAYLDGDYPLTNDPKALWPSEDQVSSNYVIPVVLGQGYVPVVSVNTGTERYYVIGEGDTTYTIDEVQAPHKWGVISQWDSDDYSFPQTDLGDDIVGIQALIASTSEAGVYNPGLWESGGSYLPMLVKLSRSDTVDKTSPADWIEFFLNDIGVDLSDLDASSFVTAAASYDSMEMNGGWWEADTRENVLSSILSQCDSYINVTDKIELYQFSVASPIVFTDFLKDSFRVSKIAPTKSDSGYVEWQNAGTPQDVLSGKTVVSSYGDSGVKNSPSTEVFSARFISDSQDAQRAAILYFQKRFRQKYQVSFSVAWPSIASRDTLHPGQMVQITNPIYGGTTTGILTNVTFSKDYAVNCDVVVLDVMSSWNLVSPPTIAIADKTDSSSFTESAADALAILADISSDSIITPAEKLSVQKEWDTIESEYPLNIAQATGMGIDEDDYAVAYDALDTYIDPILTASDSNSEITGSIFRAKFTDYYDARTNLLNAFVNGASKNRVFFNAGSPGDTTEPDGDEGDIWVSATDQQLYTHDGFEWVAGKSGQGIVKSLCFKRGATRPSTPTNGSYSSLVPTGWHDGIPNATSPIWPVWMSTRIFTSDGLAPQQSNWTTPQKIGEAGQSSKNQFSETGSSWNDTPSIDDVYMRSCTSTDGGSNWTCSGAVKIKGEDGTDGNAGTPGSSGLTTAVVRLYVRYPSTPSTPNAAETYVFSTGILSDTSYGWEQDIPAVNGDPLWTITALASATAPTTYAVISYDSWSDPIKILEDGADGTDGTDGTDGADAKLIRISTTSQLFKVDTAGDYSPASITLTANKQNTTGTVTWTSSPSIVTGTGDTKTLSATSMSSYSSVVITAIVDGISDTMTISKAVDGATGADAYTVFLTNENHTYPYDSTGSLIGDFETGYSQVRVYNGTTLLTYNSTPIDGQYKIVSRTTTLGTMVTTASVVENQYELRPISFSSDTAVVQLEITAKWDGVETTFEKWITYNKVSQGEDGASGISAITINLSNSSHILPVNGSGTIDYSNSGTNITVFEGATPIPVDTSSSYATPSFRVTASGTNITANYDTYTTYEFKYENASNITSTAAYIDFTIIVKNTQGVETTFVKRQVFTKSTDGIDASNWSSDIVFSSSNYYLVSWAAGGHLYSGSATRNISSGNTGTMYAGAITYIYFDPSVSTTTLRTTTSPENAVGDSKILVAVAKRNSDTASEATYQVFGGSGGALFTADNIASNAITTNKVASNAITAAKIDVTDLFSQTITIASGGSIKAGDVTIDDDGIVVDDESFIISSGGGIVIENGGNLTVEDGGDIIIKTAASGVHGNLTFKELDNVIDFDIYAYSYNDGTGDKSALTFKPETKTNSQIIFDSFEYFGINNADTISIEADSDMYLKSESLFSVYADLVSSTYKLGIISDPTSHLWNVWSKGTSYILTASVSPTAYLGGIGTDTRFHIKTDGEVGLYGDIIPTSDGASDIGSTTKAIRKIYTDAIALGGTDDDHTIEEYEEGEYTATLTSPSGSITLNSSRNTLSYTKIGRQVTIVGYVLISSISSPSGGVKLNLPFSIANLTEYSGQFQASVGYTGINALDYAGLTLIGLEGDSVANICKETLTGFDQDPTDIFKASSVLMFSFSYFTS